MKCQPLQPSALAWLKRSVGAGFAASTASWVVFTCLSTTAAVGAAKATLVGQCTGTVVSYLLCRMWAFKSQSNAYKELICFVAVSATGALWCAWAMALIERRQPSYQVLQLSWVGVALAVSWSWNIPLQRLFVFPRKNCHR